MVVAQVDTRTYPYMYCKFGNTLYYTSLYNDIQARHRQIILYRTVNEFGEMVYFPYMTSKVGNNYRAYADLYSTYALQFPPTFDVIYETYFYLVNGLYEQLYNIVRHILSAHLAFIPVNVCRKVVPAGIEWYLRQLLGHHWHRSQPRQPIEREFGLE